VSAPAATAPRPFVLGIGGSTRSGSSSEQALEIGLRGAERAGAETMMLAAGDLDLPMYAPERPERTAAARRLVSQLARADGVLIASPSYHGGLSGLVKNALDYAEDLRDDVRPYLDGRAVGCIVCAHGWQATTTTLVSLRSVVHALRGWPTPLGVALNTSAPLMHLDGTVADAAAFAQLELVGRHVVEFARVRLLTDEAATTRSA
jgi:FMN reductase